MCPLVVFFFFWFFSSCHSPRGSPSHGKVTPTSRGIVPLMTKKNAKLPKARKLPICKIAIFWHTFCSKRVFFAARGRFMPPPAPPPKKNKALWQK